MNKQTILGICFAVVLLSASISMIRAGGDAPGHEMFLTKKCNLCHSVSTVGIEAKTKMESLLGPDMKGIASRHDADWIGKYLKKECDLNGNPHKKAFKGTDEELQTLIDWLLEQK